MKSRAVVALALILGAMRTGEANISPECRLDGRLFSSSTNTINVYISSHSTQGLSSAIGLSFADTERAIIRLLHIINEEHGSFIRLRYSGTTTSTGYITGGLVIKGNSSLCPAGNRAADASKQIVGGVVTAAIITYYKKNTDCSTRAWSTSEAGDGAASPDVVTLGVHEIGHAVFDVHHPDEPSEIQSGNCEDFLQLSVMRRAAPINKRRARVPKDWDIEIFQQRYPLRSAVSRLMKSYRTGSATWQTANLAQVQTQVRALFRPGTLAQNVPNMNLAWGRNAVTTALTGGGAVPSTATYVGSMNTLQEHAVTPPYARMAAMAAKPGTAELLLAYHVRSTFLQTPYTTGSDIGVICYRKSLNGGTTFGNEVCGANNSFFRTTRNGTSVAYDPASNSFLIGFVGETDSDDDSLNAIHIWTVPSASGATVPEAITTFNIAPRSFGSWHAPVIACTGVGSSGCRVVYQAPNNSGCVRWFAGGVNLSTGRIDQGALSEVTNCVQSPSVDMPSVSFNPLDNVFVMAITERGEMARAYHMAPNASSWGSIGTIATANLDYISSVVLGQRTNAFGTRTQAWFIKYR